MPTTTGNHRTSARCNGSRMRTALALVLAYAGTVWAQSVEHQSPIDINTATASRAPLAAIVPAYQADATLSVANTYDPHRVPLLDKEWATLRANVPGGSFVRLNGHRFDLLQFHFHTPAEHAVNRSRAPMEVHFVHLREGALPCEPDALLVIGARIRSGKPHRELDKIFGSAALPEDAKAGTLTVSNFDIGKVLPSLTHSWRYTGSLTAPSSFDNCALVEGGIEQQLGSEVFPGRVSWVVLRDQIEMSSTQIDKFKQLFEEGNSRKVQPLNQRPVVTSLP